MKRFILGLLILMFSNTSKATHLMGGQMTSRNIGGLTYEITLTAYRDTTGITMYPSTDFNFSDSGGTWTQTDHVAMNGPVSIGNGVEEYTYVDTITFPSSGNYSMWYEDCCRNCAILNIANPCSYSFHLYNNLWVDSSNSSPVFLNGPITIAQNNVVFTYNPLPFDVDGDSISWTIDVPVTSGGAPVAGYSLPSSDTSMPFAMDPSTGVISFLPNAIGNYEVSVKVNEFRNGVQIGEIRRDMQIIVVNSLNVPVLVSSSSNSSSPSTNQFNLTPGSQFTLTVAVLDQDYRMIAMRAFGEPFQLANNRALLSTTNSPGFLTGTVQWSPDASQVRSAPYIMALRVVEPYAPYTFSNDLTFELRLNHVTGIPVIKNTVIRNVFPNPNNGSFTLEIHSILRNKGDVVIINMLGQQVHSIRNILLHEGVNAILLNNSSLSEGHYVVRLVSEGKTIATKNFEIIH